MMLKDYASNAREYGHFSEYSALAWTASWGGSSGVAIDAASTLTGKSRGVAARLAEMGYLQAHQWQESNHIKLYYTVTKKGVDFARENEDRAREFAKKYGYPFSPLPDKIPSFKTHSAVHDMFCQALCAIALITDDAQYGRAKTYYSTPDLYGSYSRGQKIPDFLVIREKSEDAFEFEYSKKSKAEILNFVDYYYRWSGHETADGTTKRLFVKSISRQINNQFLNVWKPGELVAAFQRDQAGRWVQGNILGTRIEHEPLECHASFQVSEGWQGLLGELSSLGKLAKTPAPAMPAMPLEVDW